MKKQNGYVYAANSFFPIQDAALQLDAFDGLRYTFVCFCADLSPPHAVIAQLVERRHGKAKVTSSILVDGSTFLDRKGRNW